MDWDQLFDNIPRSRKDSTSWCPNTPSLPSYPPKKHQSITFRPKPHLTTSPPIFLSDSTQFHASHTPQINPAPLQTKPILKISLDSIPSIPMVLLYSCQPLNKHPAIYPNSSAKPCHTMRVPSLSPGSRKLTYINLALVPNLQSHFLPPIPNISAPIYHSLPTQDTPPISPSS